MFLTGFIASFLGGAAYNVVTASNAGLLGAFPTFASILVAILPAVLAALGVYALVNASEEGLRYEAGLFSSQGFSRSSLIKIWVVLYAAAPSAAYVVGLGADLVLNVGSSLQIELVLPLVISVATTFFAVVYETSNVLRTSPYATLKA
jgi:hypothetical protein